MDFNEILNSTVASILCTVVVSSSVFIFKILKRQYTKNKKLFISKLSFYTSLIGSYCGLYSSITIESNYKWLIIIVFIVNTMWTIYFFENNIKQIKDN